MCRKHRPQKIGQHERHRLVFVCEDIGEILDATAISRTNSRDSRNNVGNSVYIGQLPVGKDLGAENVSHKFVKQGTISQK